MAQAQPEAAPPAPVSPTPPVAPAPTEPVILQSPLIGNQPATTADAQPAPQTPRAISVPIVQSVPAPAVEEAVAEPAAEPTAVASPAPAPRAAAAPARVRATSRETVAPASVAPAADIEPVAMGDNSSVAMTSADTATEMQAVPAPVEFAPPAEPIAAGDSQNNTLIAAAVAGLIPLALVVFLFMWIRSGSRVIRDEKIEKRTMLEKSAPPKPQMAPAEPVALAATTAAVTPKATPAPAAPVIEQTVVFPDDDVKDHQPAAPAAYSQSADYTEAADGLDVLPSAGAAVALPKDAPEDFDERSDLLMKMIDAKPDRANPFRSPRARLRRARLILQSLGRSFKAAAPSIDLSQYPNNWPELSRLYRKNQYSPA
ncbi:hypothetical protein [Pontixanthobacter aquaemixtae]|nr:hypothetical protein [Pontixanthobacter aquaemixtae]